MLVNLSHGTFELKKGLIFIFIILCVPINNQPCMSSGVISILSEALVIIWKKRLSPHKFQLFPDKFQISLHKFQLSPHKFQLSSDKLQLPPYNFELSPDKFQLSPEKLTTFKAIQNTFFELCAGGTSALNLSSSVKLNLWNGGHSGGERNQIYEDIGTA